MTLMPATVLGRTCGALGTKRTSVKRVTPRGQAPQVGDEEATGGSTQGAAAERPHLLTNVATTDASVVDAEMTTPIHRMLAGRNPTPAEHSLDSGPPSAELILDSLQAFGVALITPVPGNSSPQACAGAGFERTAFAIGWDARQAICP
jgi:hypothetical protein